MEALTESKNHFYGDGLLALSLGFLLRSIFPRMADFLPHSESDLVNGAEQDIAQKFTFISFRMRIDLV
jgi:hypothetical protein